MNLLADAQRELAQKSRSQIEEETAYKWAARAAAAYRFARESGTNKHRWLRYAESYFSEAVEHASLADDTGEALHAVREWMGRYIPRGTL